MDSLSAHLSARFPVDFGTSYHRTPASEQCTVGLQVPLSCTPAMQAIWRVIYSPGYLKIRNNSMISRGRRLAVTNDAATAGLSIPFLSAMRRRTLILR